VGDHLVVCARAEVKGRACQDGDLQEGLAGRCALIHKPCIKPKVMRSASLMIGKGGEREVQESSWPPCCVDAEPGLMDSVQYVTSTCFFA
jgi:hypothetical protein